MTNPSITVLRFTPASTAERDAGLIGFITINIDGWLFVDGLSLRRGIDGVTRLMYPERKAAGSSRRFALLWPTKLDARQAIETQVLDALGMQGHS